MTSFASVALPAQLSRMNRDYLFCVNFFSSATVSACRPLRRRAFMTLRPPLVDMRARKPNLRMRLMRFGWYVRLVDTRTLLIPCLWPITGSDHVSRDRIPTRRDTRWLSYGFRRPGRSEGRAGTGLVQPAVRRRHVKTAHPVHETVEYRLYF
jgi:hypothetical protein